MQSIMVRAIWHYQSSCPTTAKHKSYSNPQIIKEEFKIPLFPHDMILYINNSKYSTEDLG